MKAKKTNNCARCNDKIYQNQKNCRKCVDIILFGSTSKAKEAAKLGFKLLGL